MLFMKVTLGMKFTMEVEDDIVSSMTASEAFKSGALGISGIEISCTDQDGNDLLGDDGHEEAINAIMSGFKGGIGAE
jgi:hypothetical protein